MVRLELACRDASFGTGIRCDCGDNFQAEQDQGQCSLCVGQHGFKVDESRYDYH
jgi:hypothetical protein